MEPEASDKEINRLSLIFGLIGLALSIVGVLIAPFVSASDYQVRSYITLVWIFTARFGIQSAYKKGRDDVLNGIRN